MCVLNAEMLLKNKVLLALQWDSLYVEVYVSLTKVVIYILMSVSMTSSLSIDYHNKKIHTSRRKITAAYLCFKRGSSSLGVVHLLELSNQYTIQIYTNKEK